MKFTKEEILSDPHRISGELRLKVLDLYKQANAGHIGCSLSCIDLVISSLLLAKGPEDTFILSKGHAAASVYATLNLAGEISDDQLSTYYKDGTTLPAHPAARWYKGIPFATGSLGHGFPIGSGVAQGAKLLGEDSYCYVLMSDGETNEGTTWEAAHYALANGLDNLMVIVDKNGLQGFGETSEVLGETASAAKWKAIGFETVEVDGHDVVLVFETIQELRKHRNGLPKMIIANTIKGKGVSYMESRLEWHYLPMNTEQYEIAVGEINERYLNQLTNA